MKDSLSYVALEDFYEHVNYITIIFKDTFIGIYIKQQYHYTSSNNNLYDYEDRTLQYHNNNIIE